MCMCTRMLTSLDYLDGQLLCGTSVGSIVMISVKQATVTTLVLVHSRAIKSVAASPSGQPYYMTAAHDRTIRRWSLSDLQVEFVKSHFATKFYVEKQL